ncbi:multiple epidermal growth factor-like domains protein 11 [Haliotis cracherodii]|uniref:multiple epidermal growth factor-like domains protein 11 n=1 Tax=Haliotis cracherodii TaxID=6455 RepID=UPI0039E9DC27
MSTTRRSSQPASKAVDGVISATEEKYSAHTKEHEPKAWWKVDLQIDVQSALIKIYFRRDFTARRNGLQLYTSEMNSSDPKGGELCHSVTAPCDCTGIPHVLNVTCRGTWRFLTVYTETSYAGQGAVLDFVEVQVLTCPTGDYGPDCIRNCSSRHCKTPSPTCGSISGDCPADGCQDGWTGTDCTTGASVNVALNKPAWMSTTLQSSQPASNAVDGVTTATHYKYSARTKYHQHHAWWKVDLQTQVQSALVKIYFRIDFTAQRNGLQLYTSEMNSSDPKGGELCHTVTVPCDGTGIPDVLNVICHGTWHYLTVYTETRNYGLSPMIDFAEVQVWICSSEKYGYNCARNYSSQHCKKSFPTHDRVSGECSDGCQDGWMGSDCTEVCDSGKYGPDCGRNCNSRHCKTSSSTCDRASGECPAGGCQDGWMGTDCSEVCDSGKYGPDCGRNCNSRHCKTSSSTCDRASGECPAGRCQDGWMGTDCSEGCLDGQFGEGCMFGCADRHCKGTSSCPADGVCSGGCQEGWTLDNCTQELQVDSTLTRTSAGIIGLAAGIVLTLILAGGLYVCLVRRGRLLWRNSSREEGVNVVMGSVHRNSAHEVDTAVSEQGDPNISNSDYAALDVETEAENDYAALDERTVTSQVYENVYKIYRTEHKSPC